MPRSLRFGRGDQADVRVDDPYVANIHCKITETPIGFVVQDMGSTNGTFLVSPAWNAIKIDRKTLIPHGWRVRIGRTTLPWVG